MIEADVVVVGSLNHDITVAAARRPEAGETVLGRSLATACGGKGANQAVAAARAGARVAMVGCVGADAAGERLLGALGSAGVDTGRVRVLEDEPSGTALIVVDDAGENAIVVVPGANARLTAADVEAALAEGAAADPAHSAPATRATAPAAPAAAAAPGTAAGGPVVLAQLEIPEAAVAAAARSAARFVLNASPTRELPSHVLQAADPLIVNAGEAAALTGADAGDPDALAAAALALGVRSVVITKGAAGASWITPDARIDRPAPRVDVVDTTGAGDVFAGTLAAALARDADPEAALTAAVEAGAAAVQWQGAQAP